MFYVYQSSNEVNDYRLVFIVSISLLCKILNTCKIKYTELYLVDLLNLDLMYVKKSPVSVKY